MVENEDLAHDELHPGAKRNELVKVVSREDGMDILDQQAQRYFGMTGEEFIQAWESGEFTDPDGPNVMRVAMLIPLAK